MRNFLLSVGAIFLALMPAYAVTVNVTTPTPYSNVTSPATIKASGSSTHPITGWHVYVDGKDAFGGSMTSTSINTSIALTTGTHTVLVRAWDSTGAYGSNTFQVTVSGTSTPIATTNDGPVAPSTARVFSKIEEMTGWGACSSAACSGTNGGVYWAAQNQTTPSLDGASTEFYTAGGSYADVLRWKNLRVTLPTTKFIYEVWFYIDNMNPVGALEFDYLQINNGKKYNFSSQCDYYYGGHWDVWDGTGKHWVHTNMPCAKFAPNTWHHYKMYGEIIPSTGQTHYFNIWVDGKDSIPASNYAYQKAEITNWPNNATVQIQQDLTSSPGNGFHQWVDKVNLYAW